MNPTTRSNTEIAALLEELAVLLQAQGSDPFRILAYRKAARVIRDREESVAALAGDRSALEALPAVGKSIGLPIMHVTRGQWHFTVLFSNTERAHDLGKIHDWVIIFSERGGLETQATVVTELRGQLRGMRVVRGREDDCLAHYTTQSAIAAQVPPKPGMQIS
jgi:hypothetical protein